MYEGACHWLYLLYSRIFYATKIDSNPILLPNSRINVMPAGEISPAVQAILSDMRELANGMVQRSSRQSNTSVTNYLRPITSNLPATWGSGNTVTIGPTGAVVSVHTTGYLTDDSLTPLNKEMSELKATVTEQATQIQSLVKAHGEAVEQIEVLLNIRFGSKRATIRDPVWPGGQPGLKRSNSFG